MGSESTGGKLPDLIRKTGNFEWGRGIFFRFPGWEGALAAIGRERPVVVGDTKTRYDDLTTWKKIGKSALPKPHTPTLALRFVGALLRLVAQGRGGSLIEMVFRPRQRNRRLEKAYRKMAGEHDREAEAREWAEGTVNDVAVESR